MFSVASLQEQIEVQYNVALDRQVLLASGGECLDANAKVCSYSAGTDTNPIFLFCKYYRGEECPRIRDILALVENKGEKRFFVQSLVLLFIFSLACFFLVMQFTIIVFCILFYFIYFSVFFPSSR